MPPPATRAPAIESLLVPILISCLPNMGAAISCTITFGSIQNPVSRMFRPYLFGLGISKINVFAWAISWKVKPTMKMPKLAIAMFLSEIRWEVL